MKNLKWQNLVGEYKMDFPFSHSNPIFWEKLLDLPAWQYHYDWRDASTTHTHCCSAPSLEVPKSRERPLTTVNCVGYILPSLCQPLVEDNMKKLNLNKKQASDEKNGHGRRLKSWSWPSVLLIPLSLSIFVLPLMIVTVLGI